MEIWENYEKIIGQLWEIHCKCRCMKLGTSSKTHEFLLPCLIGRGYSDRDVEVGPQVSLPKTPSRI